MIDAGVGRLADDHAVLDAAAARLGALPNSRRGIFGNFDKKTLHVHVKVECTLYLTNTHTRTLYNTVHTTCTCRCTRAFTYNFTSRNEDVDLPCSSHPSAISGTLACCTAACRWAAVQDHSLYWHPVHPCRRRRVAANRRYTSPSTENHINKCELTI